MNAIVNDIMTTHVVAVCKTATFKEMATQLREQRVSAFPVVDDRLIGIVSRSDVLSVYSRPDADIRQDITGGVVLDTALTDPARFTVTVIDGVVTLEDDPETAAGGPLS